MANDLVRTKKLDTQTEVHMTEADMAAQALGTRMLFGAEPRTETGPPHIVVAFDCTSSMDEYIENRQMLATATTIADALYAKAGAAGLWVKVAFFRGDGDDRQFQISNEWYHTPEKLARAIAAIEHRPGWTQHCRLLRQVLEENKKQAVQQVVIVSDAFETKTPRRPHGDDLVAAKMYAEHLRDIGTKVVYAYKGTIQGGCPLDRAGVGAEQAFREIAEANGGACFLLEPTMLITRFNDIASQAVLAAQGDVAGAQQLLEHLQAVPFDMQTNVIGAQVPRCKD